MTIQVNLTEEQVFFLRQFAEKQKPGLHDNLGTHKPLHIVQTKIIDHVFDDGNSGERAFFSPNSQKFYESEVELIEDISGLESHEIRPYEDAEYDDINDVYITSYQKYFEAYDVEGMVVSVVERWRDVSYHFTLVEAKKYIKYQGHNLNDPRTYTVAPGYANKGDYEPFWDLLMTIGTQLVEEGAVAK